jgi:hypothetical protein
MIDCGHLMVIFLDIASAYDLVHIPSFLGIFNSLKIPPQFIRFVSSLFYDVD